MFLAVVVVLVGMFVYLVYDGGRDTDARLKREAAAAAKKQADLTVGTLPPGVEDAWRTFIADRATAVVRRDGARIVVQTSAQISYLRPSISYSIICNQLDPTIVFGEGEDAIVAHLLPADGPLRGDMAPPRSDWNKATDFPALRVDPDSVAAKRLSAELCSLAASNVSETMRP